MTKPSDSFRAPLARARGLGSLKGGVDEWLKERISAFLILPLSLWLVFSLLQVRGFSYADFSLWIEDPAHAGLLASTILLSFYHGAMGLKVVIEDYVSCEATKLALLIGQQALFGLMALLCLFSILKLAL